MQVPPVVFRVLRLRPVPQSAENGEVDTEDDEEREDELDEGGDQVVRRPIEKSNKNRDFPLILNTFTSCVMLLRNRATLSHQIG